MSPPRLFFYVQHLLGIGHLARASRIADAAAEAGFEVTVVTGGLPVAGFPGLKVRHLALPAIASGDAGFSGLVDAAGHPVDEAFKSRRRDLLLAAYAEARPDVVMIEAFPFGRRQVRFELVPLIEAIAATTPRPRLVTSLRDILQERAKPGRDEETVALVEAHFDRVLVHGDPGFVRLEETFPLAIRIADRIAYTGLVAPPPPQPPTERFDVVVSAGGGAVGREVILAAARAAALLPGSGRWCLITGPNLPEADAQAIAGAAAPWARIERFRTDFASLLTAARLSISQAGYNTVCDLLTAGCRSLLLPFTAGGETEQALRAARLQRLGLATCLTEADLAPERLASLIAARLDQPPPVAHMLDTGGAAQTARLLREMA